MTLEDERLERAVRSAVLNLAVPETTVVDAEAAIGARRARRQRISAVLVGAVVVTALVTTGVMFNVNGGTNPSTVAASPPGPAPSDTASASSSTSFEWEDWVVMNPQPSADIPPGTLEAAEQVNAVFRGREDDWAEAYIDDDRTTVVVNVKAGREVAMAEQIAQVEAIGLAPVRIRPVKYSFNELMSRTEPLNAFTNFAGSRYTGARVDQRLNSLVVSVDKVTPEAVQAVHDVVGNETYVEERALATWPLP